MPCKAEHDALTATRSAFSRADNAVVRASQYYTAASLGALGTSGGFLLALLRGSSPPALLIAGAAMVGGWIGEEAAASGAHDAATAWKDAKDKYDAAKQAYCTCVLSALPPDAG